jgi:endoglucanase
MKTAMKRADAAPLCLLVSLAITVSAAACVPFGEQPASAKPAAMKECGPDGVIDDFEDNNNQISVVGERGGYWYTYADKQGSTIWPEEGEKGGTFTVVEGGYNSKYAVEMKGKLAPASIVYAAMGLNFLDPKGPFDASQYAGITFFAKRSPGSTSKLTVKLPDGNTDPDGAICSACYNDYGAEIQISDQWKRYVLPFRDLKQEPYWGAPRKPHADPSKLFAIHWEAKASGADFDFWVDDIAFICKG